MKRRQERQSVWSAGGKSHHTPVDRLLKSFLTKLPRPETLRLYEVARRRGGSGVPLKRYPISRKKVEVINSDGSFSHYAEKADAISKVRADRADWDDILTQKKIFLRDERVIPHGKLDEWRGQPSGNYLPGFKFTREDKALRGPLVLQLV